MKKEVSKKLKIASLAVPMLFSVFFAHQVYLVQAYDFTVWKGGGMGMFSSPDHPSKRNLRFTHTDVSGVERTVVFSVHPFYLYGNEFRNLPNPKYLSDMRSTFRTTTFYIVDQTDTTMWLSSNPPQSAGLQAVSAHDLQLELWKMDRIDEETNTMHGRKSGTWPVI